MSVINEIKTELKKFGLKEVIAHNGDQLGLCDAYCYKELRVPYYIGLSEEGQKKELEEWYFKHSGTHFDIDNPNNL